MDYIHEPLLAPTAEMLGAYRSKRLSWDAYEDQFVALMRERAIESAITRDVIAECVLLCSEDKPHRCHRRLVAEVPR